MGVNSDLNLNLALELLILFWQACHNSLPIRKPFLIGQLWHFHSVLSVFSLMKFWITYFFNVQSFNSSRHLIACVYGYVYPPRLRSCKYVCLPLGFIYIFPLEYLEREEPHHFPTRNLLCS